MPIVRRRLSRSDVLAELRHYEQKHGVPSERLVEALSVDGVLNEDHPDFSRWSQLWAAERIMRGAL